MTSTPKVDSRVSWGLGLATLLIAVAALGIRVLELFVDPAIFVTLPDVQQRLFRTTDVLLTGAVLGGGSDALLQLTLACVDSMNPMSGASPASRILGPARSWPTVMPTQASVRPRHCHLAVRF